ncbi:MAG TPA: hypothetical protein DEP84_23405 [Chloroflexi bacterium]|nr:hypothetical protein [Chloroflexota bacterium]
MQPRDDGMLDAGRQQIAEELRALGEAIPYREAFRTQLREQLIARAEARRGGDEVTRRDRLTLPLSPGPLVSWPAFWRAFAFVIVVAVLIAAGTLVFVPSARAQVGEALRTWFRLEWGGLKIEAGGRPPAFTPFRPDYLPPTLSRGVASGTIGETEGMRLFFGDPDNEWLIVDQIPAPVDRALLGGERVQVNETEGVLLTGQSGVVEIPLHQAMVPGERPRPREIQYEHATRLIWYANNTRVELLSNLPVQEILKIARSMQPAGEVP